MGVVFVVAACGRSERFDSTTPDAGAGQATGTGGTDLGSGGADGGGDVGGAGATTMGGMGGVSMPEGCLTSPARIDGLEFNVSLPAMIGPRDLELVFRFQQNGDAADLLVGSRGQARLGSVRARDDGRWVLVAPFEMIDRGTIDTPDNGVTLTALDVCIESTAITGSAEYRIIADEDDYEQRLESEAPIVGSKDIAPPEWVDPDVLHPLARRRLEFSEPLDSSSTAMLLPSLGEPLALEAVHENGTIVAFVPSTVLPLGLEATSHGMGSDLAGNLLAGGFLARTPPHPGVQAQDGFESEIRAVMHEGDPVEVATSDAALEGSQSARIHGGTDALFLLAREASTERVLFDLKPEIRLLETDTAVTIRAGVVGGEAVTTLTLPLLRSDPDESVHSLELVLSEPGENVLVSIHAPFVEASASADVDAVVDRLRIE